LQQQDAPANQEKWEEPKIETLKIIIIIIMKG